MPTTIPHADPLGVRAVDQGDYENCTLYQLDDRVGIWRRVSREKRRGIQDAGKGAVVALGPDGNREGEPVRSPQEFVRWTAGEKLLRPLLPGVESPGAE